MSPRILQKYTHDEKKSTRKIVVEIAGEYAESTSIHGISYMSDRKHSPWRPAWAIVAVLALTFAAYQVAELYKDWQDEPVVTTLDTIVQPIQEIKFPAVTICPQGSRQEIMDSVLYRQFKDYISQKKRPQSKLTNEEMMRQVEDFLKNVYPGSKGNPTELIKVMTSSDPKTALQNEALSGKEEKCDSSFNHEIANTLNKDLNNDTCPDGFEMLGNLYCVHQAGVQMSNDEAYQYCNDQGGAELLHLDSYEDLYALNKYIVEGKPSTYITYFCHNEKYFYQVLILPKLYVK